MNFFARRKLNFSKELTADFRLNIYTSGRPVQYVLKGAPSTTKSKLFKHSLKCTGSLARSKEGWHLAPAGVSRNSIVRKSQCPKVGVEAGSGGSLSAWNEAGAGVIDGEPGTTADTVPHQHYHPKRPGRVRDSESAGRAESGVPRRARTDPSEWQQTLERLS